MTTPRVHALVSLAVMLMMTAALAGCTRASSRLALDEPSPVETGTAAIRFDNNAREYVHVYLISAEREWLLGRVEPGAAATLRIPQESLVNGSGPVQLAVLTGERITQQAARDPRAKFTIAQPASEIVTQRWRFAEGQLTSLGLRTER